VDNEILDVIWRAKKKGRDVGYITVGEQEESENNSKY
jgi:hypothetical protein